MGFRALISALAAAACAAGFAACGGDDEGGPIPEQQGTQLLEQLDEIEAAVESGDCDRARELAVSFAANVDALPLEDEEDRELKNALVEASGNLVAHTEDPDQCAETGATGETGTVPTTETTTTTTEPPTTTEEEEPEEEEDDGGGPPDRPPGGGNGNQGGGSGNDGGGNTGGDDSSGGIGSDG